MGKMMINGEGQQTLPGGMSGDVLFPAESRAE